MKPSYKILMMLFSMAAAAQKMGDTLKVYDLQTGYQIRKMVQGNHDFQFILNGRQDTVRVWTVDKNFATPDNFRIGQKFKDLPKSMQIPLKLPGRGWFVKTPSGYRLFFCEGDSCTEPLGKDSEVQYIERILIPDTKIK